MKKASKRAKWFLLVLACTLLFVHLPMQARADENAKIVATSVSGSALKIYVKGGGASGASFQIGNRAEGTMEALSLADDASPLRTLIMLDNSMSVAAGGADAIALIQRIISDHLDGERIRLAVFGAEITYLTDYSDDYLGLYNTAGGITFQSQETYLTDILLPVLNEIASDGYEGLTRLVVISDGVDNKELGLTRTELENVLHRKALPVYTVGVRGNTATANEDLEAMFSISRMTGAESFLFADGVQEELSAALRADEQITIYRAQIPAEIMDGSDQSVQLTLSDNTRLTTQVTMPFGTIAQTGDMSDTGATTVPSEPVTPGEPVSGDTSEPDQIPPVSGSGNSFLDFLKSVPLIAWILIGSGVLLLLILLIVLIAVSKQKKKAAKNAQPAQPPVMPYQPPQDDGTEYLDAPKSYGDGNTEMLFATGAALQIRLEDVDNPAYTFTETITGPVIVGRSAEQARIVIAYDKSVSRAQCRLFDQGGQLFVENLSDKNITKINDQPVGAPSPLHPGDILTMGRVRLRISMMR